jgi:hypothetical protein
MLPSVSRYLELAHGPFTFQSLDEQVVLIGTKSEDFSLPAISPLSETGHAHVTDADKPWLPGFQGQRTKKNPQPFRDRLGLSRSQAPGSLELAGR